MQTICKVYLRCVENTVNVLENEENSVGLWLAALAYLYAHAMALLSTKFFYENI